jgi:hypothetical protein
MLYLTFFTEQLCLTCFTEQLYLTFFTEQLCLTCFTEMPYLTCSEGIRGHLNVPGNM